MPFGFKRDPFAEPPPPGAELLGRHPGTTVREFDSMDALRAFCEGQLGVPRTQYGARRAGFNEGCWVPTPDIEAIPSPKAIHDPEMRGQIVAHEDFHPWGFYHDETGHRWLTAQGQEVKSISPDMAKMMMSMALATQRRASQQVPPPAALMPKPRP